MSRLGLPTTALSVGACMLAFACGETSPSSEPTDGTVAASEATRQALGVARWSTKDAPASIDGYDDAGKTVVSLKHAFRNDGSVTEHAFVLREHEREAVTQVAIATDADGLRTFILQRLEASDDTFVDRVLGRMQADLAPTTPSLSTNRLRASDVPWTEPSVELVCGDASSELVKGADTCMTHKSASPQEGKAWALACNDYLASNPWATRDRTACKETAKKPCTCVDQTKSGWMKVEAEKICKYEIAGVGQYEPAQNCDDPTKKCPKQNLECVSRLEWCRMYGKPDDC